MPLRTTSIDLLHFVTEIVRSRETAVERKGLSLDLKGNSGKKIRADARQLRRAIGHLLDNAIANTHEQGRILVDISKHRGQNRLVISDNGKGMTQHELARALEGIRMTSDGKGIERRQGLGIPLARQMIEAHGGTFEIQSSRGSGTAITILLP